MEALPFEIACQIWALLNPFSVFRLSLTSRRIYTILSSTEFARLLIKNQGRVLQPWPKSERFPRRYAPTEIVRPLRYGSDRKCPDAMDVLWMLAPPAFADVYAQVRLADVLHFNGVHRWLIPSRHAKLQIPVSVDRLNGVTELVVKSTALAGHVPYQIGELVQLKKLVLHGARLSGSLEFVGRLRQLEVMDLRGDTLPHGIPPTITRLCQLTILSLIGTIHGEIPSEIGNLRSLKRLVLRGNALHGKIPSTLGHLKNSYIST